MSIQGELNEKHRRFCEEYVKCYNGAKAYQTVYGCSYNTANSNSTKLLREQKIKDYLTVLEKEIFEASRINYERIAQELAKMAFGEDVKESTRLRAIDLLQKQLGLQTQKIDAKVNEDINITIE